MPITGSKAEKSVSKKTVDSESIVSEEESSVIAFTERVEYQARIVRIIDSHFGNMARDLERLDAETEGSWGKSIKSALYKAAAHSVRGLDLKPPSAIKTLFAPES